jgi:single-strand DNA-binding protein
MAANLNKVMLIGRLGRDPELRYSQSGQPVCNFSMATDESYSDRDGNRQERTEWHRIVVFARQAENVANYLKKGSQAFVEGRLQTRQWEDKEGQTRYTTEIVAQRVQFLDSRQDSGGGYQQQQQRGGNQRGGPQRQSQNDDMGPAFPSEAGGMDDVPF